MVTADRSNGTLGNFTNFIGNGTLKSWRIGHKITGDTSDGTMGDVDPTKTYDAYFDLVAGGGSTGFHVEFGYWTGDINTNGSGSFFWSGVGAGSAPWFAGQIFSFQRLNSGTYYITPDNSGAHIQQITESSIPRHTGVTWFADYLYSGSGGVWTYQIGYKLYGQTAVIVYSGTANIGQTSIKTIGFSNTQNASPFSYAIGGIRVFAITTTGDFGIRPDTVESPMVSVGGSWLNLDAVSGGNGTLASPWTLAQYQAGIAGSGIKGIADQTNARYADYYGNKAGQGEFITVTGGASLVSPDLRTSVRQRGMVFYAPSFTDQCFKQLPTSGWTANGTYTNLWTIQDTEASPVTGLHPEVKEAWGGLTPIALTSNLSNQLASANTTAGSYCSDPANGTLFLHPTAGVGPNTSGLTYQRGVSPPLETGFRYFPADQVIVLGKTIGPSMYDKATLLPGGTSISYDASAAANGTALIQVGDVPYFGKHFASVATNAAFTSVQYDGISGGRCRVRGGWRFGGVGAQSAIAFTSDNSGNYRAIAANLTMLDSENSIKLGSPGYEHTTAGTAIVNHGNASITDETLVNLDLGGANINSGLPINTLIIVNDISGYTEVPLNNDPMTVVTNTAKTGKLSVFASVIPAAG